MDQEGETDSILNLHDLEAVALEPLDAGAFAYYSGLHRYQFIGW